MSTADNIRNEVSTLLDAWEIKHSVSYRGLKRNALGGEYSMDEWEFLVYFPGSSISLESFEFFTGLGLRSARPAPTDGGPLYVTPGTLLWEQLENARKPVAPHIADLLYSLTLDAESVNQSFDDWCACFGYDSDSIKAEGTYRACQKNAKKLRRIFTHEQVNGLSEILSEY